MDFVKAGGVCKSLPFCGLIASSFFSARGFSGSVLEDPSSSYRKIIHEDMQCLWDLYPLPLFVHNEQVILESAQRLEQPCVLKEGGKDFVPLWTIWSLLLRGDICLQVFCVCLCIFVGLCGLCVRGACERLVLGELVPGRVRRCGGSGM